MPLNDNKLILQIQRGNKRCADELVERYYSAVHRNEGGALLFAPESVILAGVLSVPGLQPAVICHLLLADPCPVQM